MNVIHVRVSEKLKQDFADACLGREMSESNVIRDLMTNFVRANKRQIGKAEEETPVTTSKPAGKPVKKATSKKVKTA